MSSLPVQIAHKEINLIRTCPTVLTASEEASGYPVSNLLSDDYSEVWKSTTPTPYLIVDFGSAQSVSVIALGNMNVPPASACVVQANTTNSWGSPAYTGSLAATGVTGRRCLYQSLSGGPYSYRYWKISFVGVGYFQCGQIFMGVPVSMNDNYDAAFARDKVRPNITLSTVQQKTYAYPLDYHWELDLSFTNVQFATVQQFRDLEDAVKGNSVPFFFCLDPNDPAEALYVRLTSPLKESRVSYDRYNVQMSLAEETVGLDLPRSTL